MDNLECFSIIFLNPALPGSITAISIRFANSFFVAEPVSHPNMENRAIEH